MAQITFKVEAFWDSDVEVWVATSDDVPGLVTEASTIEVLTQKLREIIPELIMYNHSETSTRYN
jgi:predicted RNase H-like HicB family nuclease